MTAFDTNILLYARMAGNPFHEKARSFLESLADDTDVAVAELVLVEYYLALRNPAIADPPLSATAAARECQFFRSHPKWQLIENADVMEEVWQHAGKRNFTRRRIIDLRLAKTLLAHGVKEFATANKKDFEGLGFARVFNPII